MSGENEIAAQVAKAKEAAESKAGKGAGQSGKAQRKDKSAFPFKVENGQIWREVEDGKADDGRILKKWVAFGSELNILARTRSTEGEQHGRLLEVVEGDGVRHVWPMPAALLGGDGRLILQELLSLGWEPFAGAGRKWRDWVIEYLIRADPQERARCVANIGWHGQDFILPDGANRAVASGERVILQGVNGVDHAFAVSGDLGKWQREVAKKAVGNSRLVLAISAAFAGPLLRMVGDDGGGFHFKGQSSSGKSTALVMAGSVWGGGGVGGYVQSWRATDNALEAMSALHNDSCLCLNELSQVEAKAAGAAAYMLANGKGKARSGREGQARKSHEWRLIFLSSGEIGLADKISEGGGRIAAGMEVRCIDLRADAGARMGIFEDIHGAADPATFAQGIKAAANKFYGVAARAFLAHLVSDLPAMREKVSAQRKAFLALHMRRGADGQVARVADRFAIVAAAGELATALGVTGWPQGVASETAGRCFADWIEERGGIGSSEVAQAKERLRKTIEADGAARFNPFWGDLTKQQRLKALGYVNRQKDNEGGPSYDDDPIPPIFYLTTTGRKEIFAGLDDRGITATLIHQGVLTHKAGGVRVPSEGNKNFKLWQIDTEKLE